MLGDSCPRGSEFESKCQILQGNVSHLYVVKLWLCLKIPKTNYERPGKKHFRKERPRTMKERKNETTSKIDM